MNGRRLDRLADGLSLLLTMTVALVIGAAIILLTSSEPSSSLYAFFLAPFSNRVFFGNMLQAATPLILSGLGLAVAFRAGAVNLGAEGQVYAGGIAGTVLILLLPWHSPWLLVPTVAAAVVTAGLFAMLSGWLRVRFGATEVITSFLIGTVLIFLFEFFLTRYLVDPTAGFPTTGPLPAWIRLPRLLSPSSLNVGFAVAVLLTIVVQVVLFRTSLGYEIRMTGENPRFASFSGMPVSRTFILAMGLSGAFAGLAGIIEVVGVQGRLVSGFSANFGWNGITVALIARLHPLGVIPAALLYGYLQQGAATASLLSDVSPRIAAIIQSLIFFLITAQAIFVWIRRQLARVEGPTDGLPAHGEKAAR